MKKNRMKEEGESDIWWLNVINGTFKICLSFKCPVRKNQEFVQGPPSSLKKDSASCI